MQSSHFRQKLTEGEMMMEEGRKEGRKEGRAECDACLGGIVLSIPLHPTYYEERMHCQQMGQHEQSALYG